MEAVDIAKYLVAFADSKGDPLTNKKLQKLLYYVQAWHLVYFGGNPLFNEQPEAWVHGPVYMSVYDYFREAGYNSIHLVGEYGQEEGDCEAYMDKLAAGIGLVERQRQLISAVMYKYGQLSAFALETLSHSEEPWLEQRQGLNEMDRSNRSISFATMHAFYSNKLPQTAA